jgi:hypothetical protein
MSPLFLFIQKNLMSKVESGRRIDSNGSVSPSF